MISTNNKSLFNGRPPRRTELEMKLEIFSPNMSKNRWRTFLSRIYILTYIIVHNKSQSYRNEQGAPTSRRAAVPRLGEFLICLFVPTNRQIQCLGDYEELFNTVWLPRFGTRVAGLIYIAQALRSAVGIVRISVVAAIVDRVWRAFRV